MLDASLYLFDGSNLFHAGAFAHRDELVDALASFVAIRGARGVVVFDGVGEERGSRPAGGPLRRACGHRARAARGRAARARGRAARDLGRHGPGDERAGGAQARLGGVPAELGKARPSRGARRAGSATAWTTRHGRGWSDSPRGR